MASSFIRKPTNAIESADEIKVGMKIWGVYGICMPQMMSPFVVLSEPTKFRDRPDFSDIHKIQGDLLICDVQCDGWESPSHCYLSDANIGTSQNDNYWFRSEEDAAAYLATCLEDWKANPEEIAEVEERRRLDREMDAADFQDDFEYED
jgi:hypothetical protein